MEVINIDSVPYGNIIYLWFTSFVVYNRKGKGTYLTEDTLLKNFRNIKSCKYSNIRYSQHVFPQLMLY